MPFTIPLLNSQSLAYRRGHRGEPHLILPASDGPFFHLRLFRAGSRMQVPKTEFYQTFPGPALR